MIGIQELIVPAIIIALIAIFGRKVVINFVKDMIGIKKEVKELVEEDKKDAKQKDNKTKN